MTTQINWLTEQRAPGGYEMASSMMLKNAGTEEYIRFYLKRIERDHGMPLDFQIRFNGYEIYAGDQIVWFGRPEDVELLRTVKFDLFEEILVGRIRRLEALGLIL